MAVYNPNLKRMTHMKERETGRRSYPLDRYA